MCGLLFGIGPGVERYRHGFADALNMLAHRGPNGGGMYNGNGVLLGHRRLSIIDLSDAASQPMFDETGNAIIFNGELYNYLELRTQLESHGIRFKTSSDTEVLLKSYLRWGPDCLQRFNGMWAVCIWNAAQKNVFVSRDRFGVKPLYYHAASDCILFASEPKALLALDPKLRAPNERRISRFIALGELYTDEESFYRDISIFPAGNSALISAKSPTVKPKRYWQLNLSSRTAGRDQDFQELLEDAVRLRLRADVPVGLSLSGGLDSSAILAGMSRQVRYPVCFTAGYDDPERSEQHWAALASSACHSSLVVVEARRDAWIPTLKKIVWHMDGPGYSPAVYPAWQIMREARARGIPVLLEGQAADELLGGYPQHGAVALSQTLRSMSWKAIPGTYSRLARTFGSMPLVTWLLRQTFPRLFSGFRSIRSGGAVLRAEYRDHLAGQAECLAGAAGDSDRNSLNSHLAADLLRDVLPGLLQYGDAISMAHSIEVRLPFMDYRLVEWAFATDETAKIDHGITKRVLRDYLRSSGLSVIAARAEKRGYPTPTNEWLLADDASLLKEYVLRSDSRIAQYCDPANINRVLSHMHSGRAAAGHLAYKLLSLEMWIRECLDTPSPQLHSRQSETIPALQ